MPSRDSYATSVPSATPGADSVGQTSGASQAFEPRIDLARIARTERMIVMIAGPLLALGVIVAYLVFSGR